MRMDELELRRRLAAAAAQASAPRFSAEGLARRIRRRRARIIGGASGSFLAVAALAVAVPLAVTNRSGPPPSMQPAPIPFQPSVTVRAKDASRREFLPVARRIPQPQFAVSPGERLVLTVTVTVPRHHTVTALWLGITGDIWGFGPAGNVGMHPVLVHSHRPLRPGAHRFTFSWTVPAGLRRGTHRWLTMAWTFRDGKVMGGIAEFGVPPLPRPAGPVPAPTPR
jgi:hypothetical protein